MSSPISRVRTDGFSCYNVAFSPFFPNKIAVAGAANFGLVGNGRLSLVELGPQPRVVKGYDSQDGLFDVAWSEMHENQLVTASGDGNVKLWDVQLNTSFPVKKWHEHTKEVFSVDWSNVEKNLFCTGSWDCSVKVWTPASDKSLLTIPAHGACVYNVSWAPSQPSTIASCSTDGYLKIWDTRQAVTAQGKPSISVQAHPTEVLSLDWNKYRPYLVATGSIDNTIRIHDIRMAASAPNEPGVRIQHSATIASILGHQYAVRCVRWSPHSADILASASYDMTARIWSIDTAQLGAVAHVSPFGPSGLGGAQPVKVHSQHTEFVVGIAWSYFDPGVIASCSWDQNVDLWR